MNQHQPPTFHPTCPCSDDLKAYADGELSFWQARRVRAHLHKCAPCREEYHMQQTISEELKQDEREGTVMLAPELRAQILDAARKTAPDAAPSFGPVAEPESIRNKPRPSFRIGPTLALAPLVLVLALTVLTLRGGKIKNTFNKAADSINTTTDEGSGIRSNGSYEWGAAARSAASSALPGTGGMNSGIAERQINKRGNLTVEVKDVEEGSDNVMRIVKSVGGFIASNSLSSQGTRTAQLETRVPVDKFEEVVRAVGKLGQVRAKNIAGQDITEQYATAQARRDVLNGEVKERGAKLSALQAQAKRSNREEREELQAQIFSLRAQAAEARARLDTLHKLAVLSSLSVTLQAKAPAVAAGTISQDMSKTAQEAWSSFLSTARIPLAILIYILAYSPLWLPAILLWRRYAVTWKR